MKRYKILCSIFGHVFQVEAVARDTDDEARLDLLEWEKDALDNPPRFKLVKVIEKKQPRKK